MDEASKISQVSNSVKFWSDEGLSNNIFTSHISLESILMNTMHQRYMLGHLNL